MGKEIKNKRVKNEIKHFSTLNHIWWGALTSAGQRRYDTKFKKLKEYCKPKKGVKILEIGCGDGEFTKRLVKLNSKVVAIDLTPGLIKKAKKVLKKKAVFKLMNAQSLKFSDNSFDIVCGISILHHIDLEKSLRECYRILRKGGALFFTEPNYINPQIFISLNILWLREKLELSPDETALVRWKAETLLKKIGFTDIKVVNFDFLYPLTPKWAIPGVEKLSAVLEKIPLIKELSGSLVIFGRK